MHRRGRLLLFALVALTTSSAAAAEKVCWPLNFAGITLGVSTEPQVRRLLGDGIFRKEEGFTGGRIYVDKNHTATLHVVFFTDAVAGELTLAEGVASLPIDALSSAESMHFNPAEGFGTWRALRLGSTEAEVIKNLGEPEKRTEDGGWVYYTTCACETPNFFTIHFRSGRVASLVLSAPAG
jgi:hypothetical protein